MSDNVTAELPELESEGNPAEIPDKLYFRVGEVSRLVGVPPYVLRFWEKEFPSLAPKKANGGHRQYRKKDVELLLEVKRLLYEKRYTIEGARKVLRSTPKRGREKAAPKVRQAALFPESRSGAFEFIRKELTAILDILK